MIVRIWVIVARKQQTWNRIRDVCNECDQNENLQQLKPEVKDNANLLAEREIDTLNSYL